MNDDARTSERNQPTNVRWGVFSLAFATSVLLYLHRYVFGFIKPILSKEWGLNNTELGAIDSAFSLTYTLFQFPFAIAADALGVHLVLTFLMVIWMSALGMMAWAPSTKWMWYAQAMLGAGQSAVYACLNRVARIWFPPAIRTTLQGLVGILGGRLGALASSLVFTSLLIGAWGLDWRTALWMQVASGVVLLFWFASMFRNSPHRHPSVNAAEVRLIEGDASTSADPAAPSAQPMTVRQMLRSLSPGSTINVAVFSIQCLLSTLADTIYSSWLPQFLDQVHHLDTKKIGIYTALPLLGGAIAGLLGGLLNDYLIRVTGNRRWSRIGVAFAGKSIAAVLLIIALQSYHDPYAFCLFLFFVKLFGDCSLTTAWGVVTDIGGKATASVFALTNSIATIGQIAAPILFGYLADEAGWPAVFVSVAVTYVLCALSWLFINCTIPVLREPALPEDSISKT